MDDGVRTTRDIDGEILALRAEKAAVKMVEEQKAKLLPGLEKMASKLCFQIATLQKKLEGVSEAIDSVKSGVPTDFRLRKPPTKRSK
jgi:hypothetical protein